MKKNQGFTLIELLVVIAIIGILSSVVLASLSTARNKASNSTVKSQLSSLRTEAELVAPTGDYSSVCTGVATLFTAASAAGGTDNRCAGDASSYLAYVDFKDPEGTIAAWCVDSSGQSVGLTAAQADTAEADTTPFICK